MTAAQRQVVAIIAARGGSKRVPRKNVRTLAGKPLICHTIMAALAARSLARVIVSTDDSEIAAVARAAGAEVPFLRPEAIAGDASPAIETLQHALAHLEEEGATPPALVLLQPTSPFRTAADIDEAVALFHSSGAATVTAVCLAHDHPYWSWSIADGALRPFFSAQHIAMGRHDLPPAYAENGAIYVLSCETVRRGEFYGSKVVPYVMAQADSLDIDTEEDLAYAEFLLSRRRP